MHKLLAEQPAPQEDAALVAQGESENLVMGLWADNKYPMCEHQVGDFRYRVSEFSKRFDNETGPSVDEAPELLGSGSRRLCSHYYGAGNCQDDLSADQKRGYADIRSLLLTIRTVAAEDRLDESLWPCLPDPMVVWS